MTRKDLMREYRVGNGVQKSRDWEEGSFLLSYNSQEFERTGPGKISRAKKEGCSSCEKKLQVNVNVGLLVVLGWG